FKYHKKIHITWEIFFSSYVDAFLIFRGRLHWCYLKTGYIYLGVFFTSMLMAWILVGGQVIGRFLA
ncbi:hypothetical protein EIG78_11590, partial [Avibacterium paragallinarum]